jgi:hypothetical protein
MQVKQTQDDEMRREHGEKHTKSGSSFPNWTLLNASNNTDHDNNFFF